MHTVSSISWYQCEWCGVYGREYVTPYNLGIRTDTQTNREGQHHADTQWVHTQH